VRGFVSAPLDDGLVVLRLEDGSHYFLGETAGDIWRLLEQPRTLDELGDELVSTYAVTRDRCLASVSSFLRDLAAKRLIERLPAGR
jgi:hypothetical protein